jgi:hypothetical protein
VGLHVHAHLGKGVLQVLGSRACVQKGLGGVCGGGGEASSMHIWAKVSSRSRQGRRVRHLSGGAGVLGRGWRGAAHGRKRREGAGVSYDLRSPQLLCSAAAAAQRQRRRCRLLCLHPPASRSAPCP